jgi:PAS domain S-box-containing protein
VASSFLVRIRKGTRDKFLNLLLRNANDGIIIVNREGTIEFANKRVQTMFGYSEGELTNLPYGTLIPDHLRAVHKNYHNEFMQDPIRRDMGRRVDLYGKRKDGVVFRVDISLTPVRVDSEVLVTAMIRDISESTRLKWPWEST